MENETADFSAIVQEITTCTKCGLGQNRTNAVPGEGSLSAKLMFVGEGPGKNEDEQGRPFCGASGKFLDELLAHIGLKRADVYITNVVKCRPPNNRDPFEDEIKTCTPYLERQIAIIKPLVISTLGRHAMNHFLPGVKIGQVHGKPLRRDGQVYIPLYHPAVALYRASMREQLTHDFEIIKKVLTKLKTNNLEVTKSPIQEHLF